MALQAQERQAQRQRDAVLDAGLQTVDSSPASPASLTVVSLANCVTLRVNHFRLCASSFPILKGDNNSLSFMRWL